MKVLLFLSLLVLAGCRRSPELVLADAQVLDYTGRPGLVLRADGRVSLQGQAVGRIAEDGTVKDTEGRTVARLGAGGNLEDAGGKTLLTVAPDGSIDNGSGVKMVFDGDGRWMRGPENTGFRLEPADSKARRAVAIALVLYMSAP